MESQPPETVPDYVKTECHKKVGNEGGKLQLDSFGIELKIPPLAIDSKAPRDISLSVLTKTYDLGNSDNEISVCFGVQCLAPDDLVLKKQVTYTIPHCAVIEPLEYGMVRAVLYTGEGKYTPEAVVNERIVLSTSEVHSCIIRENVLKLTMDHFSWAIITFLRGSWPGGEKKMCCRPFKKKDLAQQKNLVILRAHLYNTLKGSTELVKSQEWEQEFIPAHPEHEVLIQTREGDLKMTCYLNEAVIGGPAVVSSDKLMGGTRICEPFQFDFTDQPERIAVLLKVGQNKRLQVDLLFQLDFATPQRRERAVSQHQAPLQGASSSQQTPQRRQEETLGMADKDRLDFDDILKVVAKKTKQDEEIDDLGRALQFPPSDIQSAMVDNRHGVSHMGSLNLLRAWAKRQKSATMKHNLIEALKKIEDEGILSKCFPEAVADTVTEPTKRNPASRTSGLPTDTTDSSGQHGAAGQSHPSSSPDDSSGQHGAVGPSHPSTPYDKWQNHTVTPAKSGPEESDREMQYVMWESLVKGNALVIGNANFPPPGKPRLWAYDDISNMEGLLRKLGYEFRKDHDIRRNLSKSEMKQTVKEFTEQLKKDNPQSAVVYISSHGNEKGIQGSDGRILQIRDLLEMFSGVLLGKPKVLIIDACWGGGHTSRLPVTESSSSSGPQTEPDLPENADIFMIHSTSYGKKTWSFTTKGSWLVDELCKVVYNKDRDLEDLDTIMLRVTTGVHKIESTDEDEKDVGTQSTTVFKQGVGRKLFFYPGYPPTNV